MYDVISKGFTHGLLHSPRPWAKDETTKFLCPAYGIPSRWILPENKEMAEIYGYTVIDPLSVMQTHLSEVVRSHAYELLGRSEVMQLVENLKRTAPELVLIRANDLTH